MLQNYGRSPIRVDFRREKISSNNEQFSKHLLVQGNTMLLNSRYLVPIIYYELYFYPLTFYEYMMSSIVRASQQYRLRRGNILVVN